MTAVSPNAIKELRERTGVGMTKCKEALEEAQGNMDKAIEILRKAGMASAVKKQGRETKEGICLAKETPNAIALLEVNAETDFVVKNDKFQQFCKQIAEEAAATKPASLEVFMQQHYSKDPSVTIEAMRSLIIQVIGENIQVKRLQILPKNGSHSYGIYSHLGGKILTLVEIDAPNMNDVAYDIAMHVAAGVPQVAEYVVPEEVPQDLIQKERDIARSQLAGKPANIIEKILDGKMNAFYDLVCLTRQKFIKDDSMTINELLKKSSEKAGKEPKIVRFFRWTIG